jgi:hypothetical protein
MSGDGTKYVIHADDHSRRDGLDARAELQRVRDCLSIYLRGPDTRWLAGLTLVVGRAGSSRSSLTATLCRLAAPDVDELHVFREPYKVATSHVKPPFDFVAQTRAVANDRPLLHDSASANNIVHAICRDAAWSDPPVRALFALDAVVPPHVAAAVCLMATSGEALGSSPNLPPDRAPNGTAHPVIVATEDILDVPPSVLSLADNVIVADVMTLHVLLAREGRSTRRGHAVGLVASDRDHVLRRADSESAVWFRRSVGSVVTAYKFKPTNDLRLTTILF